MGRTWILCDSRYKKYKVCFLTKNERNVDGNYLRFLELLGVQKDRLISVSTPTRFSEIIIPFNADLNNEKELFYKPFRYIADMCSDEKYSGEQIYLSRCHFKEAMRKEKGEKHIEALFRQNGFNIYYPETLTLDDQVAMFKNAKTIACINGTIPLNIVFGRRSLKLIVLNKASLTHQNLINVAEDIGIEPIYVDVYREPIKGHPRYLGEGPFWMITTGKLKEWFEKNGLQYCLDKSECSRLSIIKNYISYYYLYFVIKVKRKTMSRLRKIRNLVVMHYIHH